MTRLQLGKVAWGAATWLAAALVPLLLLVSVVRADPFGGVNPNNNNHNSNTGVISGSSLGYNSVNGGSVGIHVGGNDIRCPRMCSCAGQTVDCSHRGLGQVPRRIPVDTERL